MPKLSAGILMYRGRGENLQVLLVHPGGPFWRTRDDGAWTIPKGTVEEGESELAAARREFEEETGFPASGGCRRLCDVRQAGGKRVVVFALEGDVDPADLRSNEFAMEWPPRSGKMAHFAEVDRSGWFTVPEAGIKLLKGQVPILAALRVMLGS